MDPRLFLSQSPHLLAAVVFGYLVLAGYCWIRRRSEVIGAIVEMTIVRRVIGDRLPFVVFVLILATTTVIPLGYVVTNYGTLWRLRSLVVVPLWLLVLALSEQPEARVRTTADSGPGRASFSGPA